MRTPTALTSDHLQTLSIEGWVEVPFAVEDDIVGLANQIGQPVASRPGNSLIDRLVPTPSEKARPRSLSAIYGQGAFPFHTDSAYYRVPPRYIVMRLVSGHEVTRPTLLLDGSESLLSNSERHILHRDVWLVSGGHGRFLASILDDALIPGHTLIRFDRACMRPTHQAFSESANIIGCFFTREPVREVQWVTGKVLIIDNWRMLHARGDVPDHDNEERVLERVLVARQVGSGAQ